MLHQNEVIVTGTVRSARPTLLLSGPLQKETSNL